MTNSHADKFYESLIDLFITQKQPFMVGGTYAFTSYTGVERATKDFDFFSTRQDYPKLLKLCSDKGYKTELLDKSWIAKIHFQKFTADIIFAEKNGLVQVSSEWYMKAKKGSVLGRIVDLIPLEEMIRSKSYIQSRDRFDGADVIHLLLRHGHEIDWRYLYSSMEKDWEVLFFYVILFFFVYPSDTEIIPQWVCEKLLILFQERYKQNISQKHITRGLLLSPEYAVAIEKWGYKEVDNIT